MSPETKFRTREIPLSGRLRTADDATTIGPNDLSVCKNMRPSDQYPRGVGGMTKINTSALASPNIRNGFHFRKAQPAESHVVAWTSDGAVWDNETAIPSAGAFDGTAIYADTALVSTGRFAPTPTGALAYANGKEACLWGGTEHKCAGLIDYPVANKIYDYSDLIVNTKTDAQNVATIHVLDANPVWSSTTYVGSIMPINGFKLYIVTPNTVASTMAVSYWDGNSWEAVATFSDGTASGGVSLAQTGTVSFASTAASSKPTHVEKVYIYWYKVVVTAAAVWSGVTISQCTVSIPFQVIKDIWDGEERPCNSFLGYKGTQFYDFTSNVLENGFSSTGSTVDTNTYAQVGAYTTTSYLYAGFIERMAGLTMYFVDEKANAAGTATITVQYWDGDSWEELSATDGTSDGTRAFAKSGWITWDSPNRASEFKRGDLGKGIGQTATMYFYRISFSAAVDSDVKLYHVAGVAAPKEIRGYSFPVLHQNRTVLVCNTDDRKNSILMSAFGTSNVFNGLDSYEYGLGQDEAFVSASSLFLRFGSSVQDMMVLCKKGETWLLEGNGANNDPYRARLFSEKIGCVAPLTMVSVPTGEEISQGIRRSFAVWQSQRGIELFEGTNLMLISDDIRDKFDPRHADYAATSSCFGYYDPTYDEYHWCVPGSQEWAFSFKYKKWFQIVRGTAKYLYGGIPVMDTSGNSYVYGFLNTGYLERLENGTDFDGNDIVHTIKTGAIALNENRISEETTLRMVKVVQVAKSTTANSMTVTHFGDTETTGRTVGAAFSPAESGKRLKSRILNAGSRGPFAHHEFQLALTTDDETCGCEPIYIVAYYDGERQHVR